MLPKMPLSASFQVRGIAGDMAADGYGDEAERRPDLRCSLYSLRRNALVKVFAKISMAVARDKLPTPA